MLFRKEKDIPEKKRKKDKGSSPKKNREIFVTTYFFVALFLGMMAYLCYFTATSRQDMYNNSYNSRQELLLTQNYRGTIYARDGEVLASTKTDAAGNETREYPYAEMFSHVVGFSTHGRTGIEAQANYYLINSNTPLSNKVMNDMSGAKNPGDSVYTTLDVELQETAYKALGVYNGAIIVTEPSTGRILAMVSKPDFDPNHVAEEWEKLTQDAKKGELINRATQGLYPPGSTFKIATALEYMRENPDTYSAYHYNCNGRFTLDGNTIQCYHGANHGSIGFVESFAKSCNSSFANIGTELDHTAFRKTLNDLLFDQELPVKFQYSRSSVHMTKDISTEEMMQTSIGQGKTLVTPLHLNMITCAIANNGTLMKPYAIETVKSSTGSTVKRFSDSAYGRLLSETEAAALKDMMVEVLESGTARVLKGQPYIAAGKTGSAEYNSKGDSHAWFTGFAPAEDPQVCVTIIIEGAGSGGDYAVPVARRIFDAYFEQQ